MADQYDSSNQVLAMNAYSASVGTTADSAVLRTASQVATAATKAVGNFGGGAALQGVISSSGVASLLSKTASENASKDLRIRLSPQVSAIDTVYGGNTTTNILAPLYKTGGLLFPFTPTIDWAQQVEYKTMSLTHSNQDYLSYSNTPSTAIRVSGVFTVQNQYEGEYLMAVLHFLRTVSKMYFGKPVDNYPSGMPPPVLNFNGYGNYMFNNLPVIVRDHSYSLGTDIDYLDVKFADGSVARLPSMMTIGISLVVQNTPKRLRDEFNLNKFRTGELMRKSNKGWI